MKSIQCTRYNIGITSNDTADEVIKELLQSVLFRHPIGLETTIEGNSFIFDHANLSYCKCHKISPSRSGSNIDSTYWIKSKKATVNLIINNKCFQYAAIIALNHDEI